MTNKPLSAQAQANKARANLSSTLGTALGGYALGSALSVMSKDVTFTDQEGLLDYLRSGPTVTVNCSANGRRAWRKHKVHLGTDGSITTLSHPDVDLEAEVFLGALGEFLPACLMVAAVVPDRKPTPGWYRAGQQSLDSRFRALHAAVLWAQDPATNWTWVRRLDLLKAAVTPATVALWREAGFTPEQALPFWKVMADLNAAKAWLAAGRTSERAARLCADGVSPDEDAPWVQAGFNVSNAQAWRRSTTAPPVEAYEWARRGFGVRDYGECAKGNGCSKDVLFAWADAGIHGTHVQAWHNVTRGNLDQALAWVDAGVAHPNHLTDFRDPSESEATQRNGQWHWRRVDRGAAFTPAEVKSWSEVGFPVQYPRVLIAARFAGITPQRWARKVAATRRFKTQQDAWDAAAEVAGRPLR